MEREGNLEQYTSDEIIRSNLRLFLQYIVQCIPATLLLANLQIYNKGQRKEIFSMSCSRPHQATEKALQILLDETERQGLFVSLIQALESLDYPKVVNILSGKYVPNELYDEKILDLFTPTIIQQLNPVEILPHLMKYGVIGSEEKQIVLAENVNYGSMRATYLLLSYLPSRMEDWFRYFLLALIDCHQEDLAKTLEPDLFLKIMTQTAAEKQEAVHQSDKRMPEASSVREHVLSGMGEADTDLKADEDPEDVAVDEATDDTSVTDAAKTSNGSIKYDSEFLHSLRYSPLADYVPQEVMKHPEIFCRLLRQPVKGLTIPDFGGACPKVPVSTSSAVKRKEPDEKNNSYEDNQADVPSVHVEQHNRDLITDGSSENEDQLDNINDLKKDLEEIPLGDLIKTEHRQDAHIKYDSEFLHCLRHSSLANYIPKEVLKHPEIFCRLLRQPMKVTGLNICDFGGARPKVPVSTSSAIKRKEPDEKNNSYENNQADVPSVHVEQHNRDQIKDGSSENEDQLDNINDLKNDLEEILLGDLIKTEHRQADKSDICEKENFEESEKSKQKKYQRVDKVRKGHEITVDNEDDKDSITDLKLKLGETPGCNAGLNALGNVETIYNRSDYVEISYNIDTDNLNGGARPKVRNLISQKRDSNSKPSTDLLSENRSQPEKISDKNIDTFDVRKVHDETFSDLVNLKENLDESKDIYDLAKVFDDLLLDDLPELDDDSNLLVETIYNRLDSVEVDYSIETDIDLIEGVEDTKTVELREYQKELAREGIEGENVIIMAPTNSGKTRVAVRIVQEHLRRQRREQRIAAVIFLVQDEILAIQQARTFAEFLPAYRTKIISGKTQRDKKEFLKDFIMRRDILVVTAQVLINALELDEIKDLTRFTLMVFDECHHANKDHPYNQILGKYIDLKIGQKVDARELPQVVGMTASLGCGGSLEEIAAMKHLKKVMANMDARCLCTVRENLEELRVYVNPPVEEIRQVKRRVDNGFEVAVNELIDRIDHYMIANTEQVPGVNNIVPLGRGSEEFHQWLAEFKKMVAATSSENARVMNPCRHHLLVYNTALMIYKDVRVKEAMMIIDRYFRFFKLYPKKDDTDDFLIALYEDLEQKSFDTELKNPKLIEMQKIILEVLGHDGNARGVIFVKTRQLARALISWMNDTEELKEFSAAEMVGQTAPAYTGGSTKRQLVDVVDYFKEGRHKILVATSVLEEGIDVSKCNLVIRYEHVTNEIVRLQSRGRARATDSKYFVLTEAGSKIVAKEEKNRLLEKLMNRLVPVLQAHIERDMNHWEAEMFQIQEEIQKKRKKETEKTHMSVSIQCLNCQTEICKSHDIKKIKNVHHIIIGLEAAQHFLFYPSEFNRFDDDELEYHGKIRCIKCSYNLGSICQYKDTQFPLLSKSTWRDEDGETYKKWKKVPFWIESFTLDDLRDVVAEREALLD